MWKVVQTIYLESFCVLLWQRPSVETLCGKIFYFRFFKFSREFRVVVHLYRSCNAVVALKIFRLIQNSFWATVTIVWPQTVLLGFTVILAMYQQGMPELQTRKIWGALSRSRFKLLSRLRDANQQNWWPSKSHVTYPLPGEMSNSNVRNVFRVRL